MLPKSLDNLNGKGWKADVREYLLYSSSLRLVDGSHVIITKKQ
jgi:hypothetical protein